ncbi:MAG: hypothetical protein FWH11_07700 [Micrococcales bacterium]|nr:hypothetical protein [Micrococcales bacterium]
MPETTARLVHAPRVLAAVGSATIIGLCLVGASIGLTIRLTSCESGPQAAT